MLTDYNLVSTTVFTPIEYGVCGYSEEYATKNFGEDSIEVYHSGIWPFEWTVAHTGKSLSEALILGSTNPQYDKRLFIDLPVQYMKTTSSEQVVYTNCFLF